MREHDADQREAVLELREQAAAEASTANRAKDEFLAMLGHELRNPLGPIQTALELMALRDPEHFRDERALIQRQIELLTLLVDDLLDVARIARGKIVLQLHPVEIAAVVGRALEMARPLFEAKGQDVRVSVGRGLVVHGDPGRLVQVVANLLTNAAKYTPAGGSVAIEGERADDTIILRVRDDGIGISPEMLPQVFELFAQERDASERMQGGLGLGLSIVRGFVGRHGGSVEVHSVGLGHGSEFVVRLPASDRPVVSAASRTVAAVAGATRVRKVLLVDDNVDAARMTAEMLRHAGHEVEVAFDGPSALALVEAFVPEVALLDIGLPVMDGYELARHLRERLFPHLPRFIALTGYGARAETPFDLHLLKPVGLETLVGSIDQVLETPPA